MESSYFMTFSTSVWFYIYKQLFLSFIIQFGEFFYHRKLKKKLKFQQGRTQDLIVLGGRACGYDRYFLQIAVIFVKHLTIFDANRNKIDAHQRKDSRLDKNRSHSNTFVMYVLNSDIQDKIYRADFSFIFLEKSLLIE